MADKEKEKCPYCGREFVMLSRHKCKEAPKEDDDESKQKSKKKNNEKKQKVREVIEASGDGVDADEETIKKHRQPSKFWQEDIWQVLLDPSLVDSEDLSTYDLSDLLKKFTNQMLRSDMVDFRISGMAIYNSAKLHHKKIKDVIDQEEKQQIEEMRERTQREIPEAMAQPLRESRKIATKDELFDAMRSAIIETMQKREVLRRRRVKRERRREKLKVVKAKGQLPKELLRHITGKEKTIEEILESWLEKIKAKIKLNDGKTTSYRELCRDVIEHEYPDDTYAQKIKAVELFEALLFLSTGGVGKASPDIVMRQDEAFGDIEIKLNSII